MIGALKSIVWFCSNEINAQQKKGEIDQKFNTTKSKQGLFSSLRLSSFSKEGPGNFVKYFSDVVLKKEEEAGRNHKLFEIFSEDKKIYKNISNNNRR
jgi:hypothetical protein